ncbi:MAG: NAD(P)/FAD-dependent oxidoreductase [Candidatus Marinimicrobia bacterium]|nr:NAD(P)/FAD-dependent oxidoreductase [Candidatus Neomarinimicrobiota bacterium]
MRPQITNKTYSPDCSTGARICLPDTQFPRLVIIGGGFAGLALVEGLKNLNIQIVLIDRNNFHQFQPLLYQVATSGLEPDSIVFPYRKQISGYPNTIFRMADVQDIKPSTNTVITNKGSISYDYLVLATGTTNNFFGMTELEENSIGLKDIRDSINIRHRMLHNLEQAAITCDAAEQDALTNFVIVGGGPAGVEMAGALAEFCKFILPKDYPEYPSSIMKIYLMEASDKILPAMSDKASSEALKYLRQMDVQVILKEMVTGFDGLNVTTKDNKTILAKNMIWTAGVKGQFPNGLAVQNNIASGNRLKVDQYLKLEGHANIFAAGDIAAVINGATSVAHPQVAQVAIQQGRYLAHSLQHILKQQPSKPFIYKDKGTMATVGKRRAVADIGLFEFSGYFAWLLWSLVHLVSISGFKNKLMVGLNWVLSYISYDKSNRLIITDSKIK